MKTIQIDCSNRNMNPSLSLIKLGKIVTCAALMFALASCGGGGSGTFNNTSLTTTITSITPVGIVASPSTQALSILGTNFEAGMTVSVTDKTGNASYMVNTVVVASPTVITAFVTIPIGTIPPDNYVYVTVNSASIGAPLASAVLGVAGTDKRLAAHVQPILALKCGTCHDGTAGNGLLDLRSYSASASASATGLIGIPSYHCAPKFRVVPGDPRRTSSVLIDKIQASIGGQLPRCGDPMPPGVSTALNSTEIQTIIDWVAGGAK